VDRLDSLRAFLAVAERLSFTAAARDLRVSPTAASRAVAAIERELGVALFRRTTRAVALTPEGAAYRERCRDALAELDDAARSLRGDNSEPRGLLVVTAPVVFGRMHVLPIVADLLRAHPGLNVRLMLTDRVARVVDEGVDVAVRIADLSDSGLNAVRVGETRRVLVASPSYLTARGAPGCVAELHNHSLLAFDNFAPNGEWRFGGRATIRFEPRLLTDSVESAIDAATAGLGITRALCYQVARQVAEGSLTILLPEQEPSPLPITLLFQANRQRSPNVRALVDLARERLRASLG
jgi:DNA-binding transcriptional LysR family regulator